MTGYARPLIWQAAVIAATAPLVAWGVAARGTSVLLPTLLFAVLVLCTEFLRFDVGETPVAFEAPVIFGAVAIYHDPAIAVLAVAAGGFPYAAYRCVAARWWSSGPFYDVAQRALSYFVVALLYASAVDPNAKAMAKVSGYILLVVGYVAVQLLFASVRRYFEGDTRPIDFRTVLKAQGKTLFLLSPIVAIEVMLFPGYGLTGFALAFVPVLVVAHSMRNEADKELQNAELIRRSRELSILTENSTQILSAEDIQETLRRLVGLLTKLARMKACAVVTWEPNPDSPTTVYRFGDCEPSDQDILRWVDAAGFSESAPSRAFVFQNEQRRFPLSGGRAIQVLIGIQTQEVIYGILIFETEDPAILQAGSLNPLTMLVNQTAVSLQDQLLRREMREKTLELESQAATTTTILDVGTSLIGAFNIDGALTSVAHAIRRALGFDVVVFGLYDAKKDEYVRRAHAGLDDVWETVRQERLPGDKVRAFFQPDFQISRSYYIPNAALQQSENDFFLRPGSRLERAVEWDENDILITPLDKGEQSFGYLYVSRPQDRKIPTIEKVKNLEIFAVQAVQAMQSSRQFEEIERLSFTDALTGAYNHRYFQETLTREIHRHSRSGHEFALAIIDLDNFKTINDTFGHPIGDQILRGLVEELGRRARESDILARYGGEEFAIIFPDTPLHAARDAANRLREHVAASEHPIAQINRSLRITISGGVAVYPRDGVTNADLIARADAALYQAKKQGKNRIAIAADVIDPGSIVARTS